MNTQELLLLAYQRGSYESWRNMARDIGFNHNTLRQIRLGQTRPGDDLCVILAGVAGVDPFAALMQLNAERSEGQARRLYEKAARAAQASSIAAE